MKKWELILLLLLTGFTTEHSQAQQNNARNSGWPAKTYNKMFRVYEDNDIINIRGDGTDQGYTNGTRFDFFFIKNKRSRFFIDRIMPKAGDSSINTFGWGFMQVMITPTDISKKNPDPADYPYSGGLYITHTLHAANPVKKYNLQTEWIVGIMGPLSGAEETQKLVHRVIDYMQPMGWDHQLKTDLLLNLNVAAEKQLAHVNRSVELIGGMQVFAGTALNGAAVYSLIRFGKMEPYFNGYISQYAKNAAGGTRRQIYFFIRPSAEWMLSNAFIEGGIFNKQNEENSYAVARNDQNGTVYRRVRERIIGKIDYGIVVSAGRIGISFTQTTMTPALKGVGGQEIGNISVHLAW